MKLKLFKLLLTLAAIPLITSCNNGNEPTSSSSTLAIVSQPTPSQTISFPEGFSLSVGVNDEKLVKSYQWQLDNGTEKDPSWVDLDCSSGRSKTLVKLATEADTKDRRYRCILTDVNNAEIISDNAYVYIDNKYEPLDVITLAGYPIKAGETFDLATTSLGSGKVKYHENGYEVTLKDVCFDNSNPVYDFYDTSNAFNVMYYDCPHEEFIINVEGVNCFTNTYWQEDSNSGGMVFAFSFMNDSLTKSVTFQGDGSLSMTGGTHLIYANRKINIGCDMVFNKIGDRYATGIYGRSIEVNPDISIDANLNGFLFQTRGDEEGNNGDITINKGANIACVSTIPHVSVGSTDFHMISAMGDLKLDGCTLDFIIKGDKTRFSGLQGVGQIRTLQTHYGNIDINDSQISSRFITNSPDKTVFLHATFIIAEEGQITISNSKITLFADEPTLYGAIGMRAPSNINIADSNIDISISAAGPVNGISTNESLTIDGSTINIKYHCYTDEIIAKGIICVGLTFKNASIINISEGNGLAILVQVGAGEQEKTYDENYVPTIFNSSMILIPTDGMANIYSLEGSIHNFVYMETIYSKEDKTKPTPYVYLQSN